jgi:hypothetical protein
MAVLRIADLDFFPVPGPDLGSDPTTTKRGGKKLFGGVTPLQQPTQTTPSKKTPDFGSIADSGFFSFPDPDLGSDPTTTKKEEEKIYWWCDLF